MAFRPEDHVVAELRYAIYAAITLHFLRKILGKVFARDERVPWKDSRWVVEISPDDLARYDLAVARYDLALSKKCLHPGKEMSLSIVEEAVMRWPDVINKKNWSP